MLALFHYGTISLAIVLPAIGVSLGEALIGLTATKAMDRQPSARGDILKTMLVGMALTETAAVIGLALATILLFGENPSSGNLSMRLAELGIALSIGIPGAIIGITSALPAIESLKAISRQPFMTSKISNIMLLTQSIGQTGTIFGFIVSLFIKGQMNSVTNLNDGLRLLASGISIGLGAVGPAIGLGYFARTAIKGLGSRPLSYPKVLTFTFISEAIIETPLIFALLASLIIASSPVTASSSMLQGILYLAASLAIAVGTASPGINSGKLAAAACEQISEHPEAYNAVSRNSIIGQSLIDTSALYALVVALLIVLFK